MKRTVIVIGLIILSPVWAVWCIVSGALGLAKSGSEPLSADAPIGTVCETRVEYAAELFTVENKLFFFIPAGTERYYFTISDNEVSPMLIKASNKWFDENFAEDGTAKQPVTVTGEIRKHDEKNYEKLSELNGEIQQIDKNAGISQSVYLNSRYKAHYGLRLVMGIVVLTAVAALLVLVVAYKSKKLANGAAIFLVIWMIAAFLGTIVLAFVSKAV